MYIDIYRYIQTYIDIYRSSEFEFNRVGERDLVEEVKLHFGSVTHQSHATTTHNLSSVSPPPSEWMHPLG